MGPRKRVKLAQNTSEGNRMDGQPTAQSVKGQGEDRGTPSVSSRRNGSPSSSVSLGEIPSPLACHHLDARAKWLNDIDSLDTEIVRRFMAPDI